jgi:predicted enzyme related to lactoylglutathione lyase
MTKRNIVHIEIPAVTLEAAGKFYQDLFGWKITPMPEMNYSTWEPAEPPGGGFTTVGEDAKVGELLIHVNSDDIDADLRKARLLGGTIVREKTEIPGVGWWGVFKDPTGNKLALFTSARPPSAA